MQHCRAMVKDYNSSPACEASLHSMQLYTAWNAPLSCHVARIHRQRVGQRFIQCNYIWIFWRSAPMYRAQTDLQNVENEIFWRSEKIQKHVVCVVVWLPLASLIDLDGQKKLRALKIKFWRKSRNRIQKFKQNLLFHRFLQVYSFFQKRNE